MGEQLIRSLRDAAKRRPVIGEIRGCGLMIGIELVEDRDIKTPVSDRETFDVVLDLATLGLLVYCLRNILGHLPPLIIDEGIGDEIAEAIDQALDTSFTAKIARKARLAKEFASSKLG